MDQTLKQADTLFFCDGVTTPLQLSGSIATDDSYATEPVFQWQTRQDDDANWTDMPGERDNELNITPTHNQWYRLTAAGSAANLMKPLCRISSDSIRFAQLAPQPSSIAFTKSGPICEHDTIPLNPPEYSGPATGPVRYHR